MSPASKQMADVPRRHKAFTRPTIRRRVSLQLEGQRSHPAVCHITSTSPRRKPVHRGPVILRLDPRRLGRRARLLLRALVRRPGKWSSGDSVASPTLQHRHPDRKEPDSHGIFCPASLCSAPARRRNRFRRQTTTRRMVGRCFKVTDGHRRNLTGGQGNSGRTDDGTGRQMAT
jgi:hypothetical protein